MNGWRTLFPMPGTSPPRVPQPGQERSFIIGTVICGDRLRGNASAVLIDFAMSTSQTRIEVLVSASGLPSDSRRCSLGSSTAGFFGFPARVCPQLAP